MKNRSKAMIGTTVAIVILGSAFFSTASVGQPGNGEEQARHFIDLMDNYLGMSNRWVSMVTQQDTAVYLAIEGIIEVYEQRGEKAKAIPHLQAIVDETTGNPSVRTVARFKMRDLYNETGRSDKALEQLELIIRENSGTSR